MWNIKSKNKYNAKQCVVDNVKFASMKEGHRYTELKLLERAGQIKDLQLQPKFLLQEKFVSNGKTIREINYIADFSYVEDGKMVVEDTKGIKTEVFKLKEKLFRFRYKDINFRIV